MKRRLCLYDNENKMKKGRMSLKAQRRPCLYVLYSTPAFLCVKKFVKTDKKWRWRVMKGDEDTNPVTIFHYRIFVVV